MSRTLALAQSKSILAPRLKAVVMMPLIGALFVGLAPLAPALGQTPDPHVVYEQRCQRCHEPHAGPFARKRLVERNGELYGADGGQKVAEFLADHAGTRLQAAELAALIGLFRSAVASGGVYERKCQSCHDRAQVFARRTLILKDGELKGRYSGRDIAAFMQHHGRLNPSEIQAVMDAMRRQLEAPAQ